jgi:hypothetical protein
LFAPWRARVIRKEGAAPDQARLLNLSGMLLVVATRLGVFGQVFPAVDPIRFLQNAGRDPAIDSASGNAAAAGIFAEVNFAASRLRLHGLELLSRPFATGGHKIIRRKIRYDFGEASRFDF